MALPTLATLVTYVLKELWRNIELRRLGKEFVCKRVIFLRAFM